MNVFLVFNYAPHFGHDTLFCVGKDIGNNRNDNQAVVIRRKRHKRLYEIHWPMGNVFCISNAMSRLHCKDKHWNVLAAFSFLRKRPTQNAHTHTHL